MGVPIDSGPELTGRTTSSDPQFEKSCYSLLSTAHRQIELSKRKHRSNQWQTWTPELATAAGKHLKRLGLSATIYAPTHPRGGAPVANNLSTLSFGFFLPYGVTSAQLIFSIDHEYGHIRDFRRLQQRSTGLAGVETKGIENALQAHLLIVSILAAMKEHFPQAEQSSFNGNIMKIFGNPSQLNEEELGNLLQTVTELLRYGEEAYLNGNYNVRFGGIYEKHFLKGNPNRDIYRRKGITHPDGRQIDLLRLSLVALFQEAGYWKTLTHREDFDPESIRHLDPTHIQFFRRCIRSARTFLRASSK